MNLILSLKRDKMDSILKSIMLAINSNDDRRNIKIPSLVEKLKFLPGNRLDELLANFVKFAIEKNNVDAVRTLLNSFDSLINISYTYPSYNSLFYSPLLEDEELLWITQNITDYTFAELVESFIEGDQDETKVRPGILRAYTAFTTLSNDEIDVTELMKLCREHDNELVYDILLAIKDNVLADIPEWISEDIIEKFEIPQLIVPKVDKKEAALLILDNVEQTDETRDEVLAKIEKELEYLTDSHLSAITESLRVAKEMKETTQTDIELFRIFGPVNATFNFNPANNGLCEKFGGCRMFLCDCFSNDEVEERDWFEENTCEECNKIIEKRCYAFRIPMRGGSWKGRYCSSTCARNALIDEDEISTFMISSVEEQLKKIGIQDREDDFDFRDLTNMNVIKLE